MKPILRSKTMLFGASVTLMGTLEIVAGSDLAKQYATKHPDTIGVALGVIGIVVMWLRMVTTQPVKRKRKTH